MKLERIDILGTFLSFVSLMYWFLSLYLHFAELEHIHCRNRVAADLVSFFIFIFGVCVCVHTFLYLYFPHQFVSVLKIYIHVLILKN